MENGGIKKGDFMYTIIMIAGEIVGPFMGGIDTFEEAKEICEGYDWIYYDENEFE